MAGHEFPEPADRKRKQVADPASDLRAVEEARHPCDPAFRHGVVVGFDGSTSSERALAYAIGMARRSGSGLIIVHVANRLPTTVWAGCE
ncbi:universal stress protein, partial [Streptomyces sp. 12297]